MSDDRRLPFGLLPPADPRTQHVARGMNDLYGDGQGEAVRPGQPGFPKDAIGSLLGRDQAMRGANQQALRMMIQRDPSLLWGRGDAMNPADRAGAQGQGATKDPMPNYAYPTSDGGNLPDTGMQAQQIPDTGIMTYPKPDGRWVGVPQPDGPSHWSGLDL